MSAAAQTSGGPTIFGNDRLPLQLPANCRGVGDLITSSTAHSLIDGVRIVPYALWPDDRGYFAEVIRVGSGLPRDFPVESTQVSAALSYPGAIKAFHYHLHQTDCWMPMQGMFQVALVDLRIQSPTFGRRNTLYVGELRPWQILIPPGVGHGYKVISREAAMLIYVTDRHYNPADEGRLPYNDPGIHYDWETQHK